MPIDSGGLHPSNSLKHPLTAEARYWEYPKKKSRRGFRGPKQSSQKFRTSKCRVENSLLKKIVQLDNLLNFHCANPLQLDVAMHIKSQRITGVRP